MFIQLSTPDGRVLSVNPLHVMRISEEEYKKQTLTQLWMRTGDKQYVVDDYRSVLKLFNTR